MSGMWSEFMLAISIPDLGGARVGKPNSVGDVCTDEPVQAGSIEVSSEGPYSIDVPCEKAMPVAPAAGGADTAQSVGLDAGCCTGELRVRGTKRLSGCP
jgi:hypothetical protein